MEEFEFDYSKLLGKIKEVYRTQQRFAADLNMSRTSLSQRLNNKIEFTPKEIVKISKMLGIPSNEYCSHFFTKKVQKHEFDDPVNKKVG